MGRVSFLAYYEWEDSCSELSDEQLGQLVRAAYALARRGEDYAGKDPAVKMAFSFISKQINRDNEKYKKTCQKRSESGKRGGLASAALRSALDEENATKSKQDEANATKSKQDEANATKSKQKQPDKEEEKEEEEEEEEEKEKEEESDKEEEEEKESPAAAPSTHSQAEKAPSVQEVSQYAIAHDLFIDAEKFCAFYGERGWKAGKNDLLRGGRWREKLEEWARTEFPRRRQSQETMTSPQDDPRTETDLRWLMEYQRRRKQHSE
jgi:hypothetical protein